MTRRLVQLQLGLVLYGISLVLLVRADLGLDPWDVFHQGLSQHIGLSLGTVTILVGILVLLLWFPIRQRPGIGTVCNVFVVGLVADAGLAILDPPSNPVLRVLLMLLGVGLNGVATAAYLGVHLGPGPRDGLMTGLVRRTGGSVRRVRTSIEVVVLVVGFVLGGSVGIGTVIYAAGIGLLVHRLLPAFDVPSTR